MGRGRTRLGRRGTLLPGAGEDGDLGSDLKEVLSVVGGVVGHRAESSGFA